MKTITLNTKENYSECGTTKYWRNVECKPQTVKLKTWSTDHPVFYLTGVVTRSHDEKEIGTERSICIQTYSFWLEEEINKGKYTINELAQ